ncbi:thioredoxin [Saccharicrinis sp. FJH62]|uniref:thioredoxin n=1 Tax=Saccharicrinis sp. FJH62 TaxID=3344657 RepID=UPI0035D4026E
MKGNFNALIHSDVPVLIDFFAEWCGPCKVQSPILAQFAREMEGKVKVIKIDVDKNQEMAARFQIRGVPTLALYKNGQSLWRQSGVVDHNQLSAIVSQYI